LFPDNTVQHGGVAVIDDQSVGEPIGARHLSYRKPANSPEVNRPLFLQAITAACMLIRKESFQAVGGFDEGYWNGYEDVDLCFKLQQRSWQIVYEPRSVLLHHESQSGPERFSRWPQNVERLQERWLGKIQPDFTIQKDRSIVEHDHGGIRAYQRPGEKKVPDRVASSGDRPRDTRHRDKRHRGQISKPKKLTSIVVLCYQALAYTKQCVASLLDHTGGDFEIILVDNGSDDGTPSYLRQVADEHSNCHLIENGENLGYAAGNNQGVAAARGEYIVLINNDVIVTDGWLDRLLYSAERDPKVGIVGPMTNRISGTQMLPEVNYDTETLAGLGKFAADLANKQSHIAVPNWRAVGFCVLIKRDVFTKIGGLDERFGRGNFEDDDFCIRAMLAGFETRLATDCFVHHYGSQSFVAARVDYEQCLRENWDIFKNKWGIPAEVEYGASYDFTPHLQGGFDPAKHYCPLPTEVITDGKASPETRIFPGDEATKLADGEELFRAGRLTEAGVAFREILAAKPHHGRARNNLACVLWQEGATEDAITELSRILARDPDNRDAAWNLGQFLHGLGHLNEAKQLYEAFAQRHPEDEELVAALTRWREHTTPQTASITKAGKATEPVQAKTPLSSTNLEAR